MTSFVAGLSYSNQISRRQHLPSNRNNQNCLCWIRIHRCVAFLLMFRLLVVNQFGCAACSSLEVCYNPDRRERGGAPEKGAARSTSFHPQNCSSFQSREVNARDSFLPASNNEQEYITPPRPHTSTNLKAFLSRLVLNSIIQLSWRNVTRKFSV